MLALGSAEATPITLRIATAAPDGSAWAREFRAWSRDVDAHTQGEVQIKWYFGAIAGGEIEVMNRMERGQIDGTASGGGLCQKLSPTQRAMRVQGLLQSHQEGTWLLGHLNDKVAKEFLEHGMVFLGGPVIGREVVFSRDEIKSFDELEKRRLWRWDVDYAGIALSRAAGLRIVPEPLPETLHAVENGALDGFLAIPSTMLAFQLLPKVRYVLDWPHSYLIGCLLIDQRAFDRMSFAQQQAVRTDGIKAILRVDEVARMTDETLLGGLLQKQGIAVERTPDKMKSELQAAMHDAHKRIGGDVPPIDDAIVRELDELLAAHRKGAAAK